MPARHHRLIGTGFALFALLVSTAGPAVAADERGPVRVGTDVLARDSWIVTLIPAADPNAEAAGLSRAAGGASGLVYRHAINGFQFKGSAQAAAALARNPRVASVTPDAAVYLTDSLPLGVERVAAWDPEGTNGAYQHGFRGNGARIAVLDTGIDLDHPDLAANIDQASGRNCVDAALPANDGYGHGSHVAGTAASPYNGLGIVGVAPEARLIAVKMFDDAGNSSEARALCALEHIIGLNSDGDPANDADVANMSWGEQRAWGDCSSDALHGAICRAHGVGIVLVAGAGNSAVDAGSFVPAAYPEVISVSAWTDLNGEPGAGSGCAFISDIFWYECDETFALFSNFGPVDVMAPGVQIYSTWASGGYRNSSGTSMATPHIAGIVALMAAAAPGLSSADALTALRTTGECPNDAAADADGTIGCDGQGTWTEDPDGVPEPLANALRAAQYVAGSPPPPPTPPSAPTLSASASAGQVDLTWTQPTDDGGSPVSGYQIFRGTSAGSATLHATVGNVLTYTDTGLTNGATYWYRVAAVNVAGAGELSNAVAATPTMAATAPSAPTGLTAKVQGSSIQLAWSAPASNGGSPLTAYRIHRTSSSGTLTFEVPASQLVYVDPSVARKTQYSYVVTAVNAVGQGPPSNSVAIRSR